MTQQSEFEKGTKINSCHQSKLNEVMRVSCWKLDLGTMRCVGHLWPIPFGCVRTWTIYYSIIIESVRSDGMDTVTITTPLPPLWSWSRTIFMNDWRQHCLCWEWIIDIHRTAQKRRTRRQSIWQFNRQINNMLSKHTLLQYLTWSGSSITQQNQHSDRLDSCGVRCARVCVCLIIYRKTQFQLLRYLSYQ